MEENLYNNEPQFNSNLHLNGTGIDFLTSAAKWAKFLAIMLFIGCGFVLLAALSAGAWLEALRSAMASAGNAAMGIFAMNTGAFMVTYLIGAVFYFFMGLFLYRFADKALVAVQQQENQVLTESIRNLKFFFKFNGILVIISLAFLALAIIILLIAGIAFISSF